MVSAIGGNMHMDDSMEPTMDAIIHQLNMDWAAAQRHVAELTRQLELAQQDSEERHARLLDAEWVRAELIAAANR